MTHHFERMQLCNFNRIKLIYVMRINNFSLGVCVGGGGGVCGLELNQLNRSHELRQSFKLLLNRYVCTYDKCMYIKGSPSQLYTEC